MGDEQIQSRYNFAGYAPFFDTKIRENRSRCEKYYGRLASMRSTKISTIHRHNVFLAKNLHNFITRSRSGRFFNDSSLGSAAMLPIRFRSANFRNESPRRGIDCAERLPESRVTSLPGPTAVPKLLTPVGTFGTHMAELPRAKLMQLTASPGNLKSHN